MRSAEEEEEKGRKIEEKEGISELSGGHICFVIDRLWGGRETGERGGRERGGRGGGMSVNLTYQKN